MVIGVGVANYKKVLSNINIMIGQEDSALIKCGVKDINPALPTEDDALEYADALKRLSFQDIKHVCRKLLKYRTINHRRMFKGRTA
jgi:hypothetical protein